MKYTVIGYYTDNDQPWAVFVEASDWESAIEASRQHVDEGWSVRVCAVLEGDHQCVDGLVETMQISNEVEA
jgi:hypothetical protein